MTLGVLGAEHQDCGRDFCEHRPDGLGLRFGGGRRWDVHCTAIIFIEGHLRPLVGPLPQTGQLRTLSDHRPVVAVSVHKKS